METTSATHPGVAEVIVFVLLRPDEINREELCRRCRNPKETMTVRLRTERELVATVRGAGIESTLVRGDHIRNTSGGS